MGSKRKRQVQETPAAAPAAKKQQKEPKKSKAPKEAPLRPTVTEIEPISFLDNPRGADLKREVELYDLLGSEDGNERLLAANAIISGLLGNGSDAEGLQGVEVETLQRHMERRLFRGLASGRKGARLGYSVVITELLGQLFGDSALADPGARYQEVNFEQCLNWLVEKTKPEGDLSGQEERDHWLGLLFGLQSFVRARICFGGEGDGRWSRVLGELLSLAVRKSWIREECGWVIVEAVQQMNQAEAETTLEKLLEAGLASSPEGVGIWLTAKHKFPNMKTPRKPWGDNGEPLNNLQNLAKALKESSSKDDEGAAKQTGNWNPKIHFAWDLILVQYLKKGDGEGTEFKHFWKVVVDDNLFSASASRERKYWGFLLFQKTLIDLAERKELIQHLFSVNLIRCLVNNLSQEDRFLHRAADKTTKVLISAVEANPDMISVVLNSLLTGSGVYNFDQVTRTKTVDKILASANGDAAEKAVESLLAPILNSKSEPKEAETRRQMFADYVLSMIRRFKPAEEASSKDWVKNAALKNFAELAYCTKKTTPELSEKSREMFRTRLTSAFAHLITDPKGFAYPCELLRTFTPDIIDMDEGISEAKDKALSTMEKLLKKAKKANEQEKLSLQALALLYALVVFQLYNGEADAVSVLDELKLCYDKLVRGKDTEDSDAEASEVLIEILLSFVSKPSLLLRKTAQHVFTAFSSQVTAGGLKLMTDVLESSESLKGQQELFDQEPEDDGEDMDIDEDEDELDSDVEIVDINGASGDMDSDVEEISAEEDNEEEEEEDGEEADDTEASKLEAALALALGTRPITAADADAESDSDADMTDSEMMALDSKLVEIFSQRKKQPNKKQEKKDAKETIINFKNRVLDLLEIYVKRESHQPQAFTLLLPLLQLIRSTNTKAVGDKAHGVISTFAKSVKKDASAPVAGKHLVSEGIKLLKEIHDEAAKDPSHAFSKAASTAALLIVGQMWRADKSCVKKVAGVYRDSQVKWVEGSVKIQASFFVDWINWCQSHAGKGEA